MRDTWTRTRVVYDTYCLLRNTGWLTLQLIRETSKSEVIWHLDVTPLHSISCCQNAVVLEHHHLKLGQQIS